MFDVLPDGRYLRMFAYANIMYASVISEWYIAASARSDLEKHYLCRFIYNMIIHIACVSYSSVLNWFGTLFLFSFEGLV